MKFAFSATIIIRTAKVLIACLALGFLTITIWFLYNNLYLPITNASSIVLLRTHISSVSIDTVKMDAVLKFLAKSPSPTLVATEKNPFTPLIQPPPPTGKPKPLTTVPLPTPKN